MAGPRSVWISIPCYGGQVSPVTSASLKRAAPLVARSNHKFVPDISAEIRNPDVLGGVPYLDHVRNIMVKRFLASAATDLVFIDDDVGFHPTSLLRLLDTAPQIVGGIYPRKCEPLTWPVAVPPVDQQSDAEGLLECLVVPTGFMRIGRSVFEALADKVPSYGNDQHGLLKAFFKTEVRDGIFWGEDVEFLRIAREAGIKAYAFANMWFQHQDALTGRVFEGNWGDVLRKLKAA